MKHTFLPIAFHFCLLYSLEAQITIVEEKIVHHNATFKFTLQNNSSDKIFLTDIIGKHKYYKAENAWLCNSSTTIVVKSLSKYTLNLNRYEFDEAKSDRLPITPLEIASHALVKIEIGYDFMFGTCQGFKYSGAIDLIFSNNDILTRNIELSTSSYYHEITTKNEIVKEITKNETSDVWFIKKMKVFKWDEAEAEALITQFIYRNKASLFEPVGNYEGTKIEAIAETIVNLNLTNLSYIIKQYCIMNASNSLLRSFIKLSKDDALQFLASIIDSTLQQPGSDHNSKLIFLEKIFDYQKHFKSPDLECYIEIAFNKYYQNKDHIIINKNTLFNIGFFLSSQKSTQAIAWAINSLQYGTSREQEKILLLLNDDLFYRKGKPDDYLDNFSESLLSLLKSDSTNIRFLSISLAAKTPSLKSGIDKIFYDGLLDKSKKVRFESAKWVGKLGRTGLFPTLLENMTYRDTTEGFWVCYDAIKEMELSNSEAVAQFLVQQLDNLEIPGSNRFYYAFIRIDKTIVVPLLRIWLLKHTMWLKSDSINKAERFMEVLKALSYHRDLSSVSIISNLLLSLDNSELLYDYLYFIYLRDMGSYSNEYIDKYVRYLDNLLPALRTFVKHTNPNIRELSIRMICQSGEARSETIKTLKNGLNDLNENVRDAVIDLIGKHKITELKDEILALYHQTKSYKLKNALEQLGVKPD